MIEIFSTNYFGYEASRHQETPIRVITDETHPIPVDDPRLVVAWWTPNGDAFRGRISAAWWSHHPHLAAPDADVTVFIGGNFCTQIPDLAERCLAELDDDDMLLLKHPWRDDILDEAYASAEDWRWGGRQDLFGQVRSYLDAGHPRNWGLFHGGMIVRRDTPAMRAFNDAWWGEYCHWSSQNQLSLPFLLRTSGLKWHTWPDEGQWRAQPFEEGWIRWGTLGREMA